MIASSVCPQWAFKLNPDFSFDVLQQVTSNYSCVCYALLLFPPSPLPFTSQALNSLQLKQQAVSSSIKDPFPIVGTISACIDPLMF